MWSPRREFASWRRSSALGPPALVAVIGALAFLIMLVARERERRARLSEEAAHRVADLLATVAMAQGDERAVVTTGDADQPGSISKLQFAIERDVSAIRAGMDENTLALARVDTLAVVTAAAIAACDTVVLRYANREPAGMIQAADQEAAALVTRVRAEAETVSRATTELVDSRMRAADREHVAGITAVVVVTALAVTLWILVYPRLAHDADRESAARIAAENANRSKSLFLATMSHELRTPLNAIIGFADLLAAGVHGPLAAAQTDDVGRIMRAAKHLLGLITDVLHFARLEAIETPIAREIVPIDAIMAVAAGMVTQQAQEKGIELERQSCDPTLTALANREKVLQILLNLLTNAVKFTPPGGQIVLACGRSSLDAPDDTVRLIVRDTGRGIPATKLDWIFEPFAQIDRTTIPARDGVGLGLAISRTLARRMQGDLFAKSEEGQGAEFTLTLPRNTV